MREYLAANPSRNPARPEFFQARERERVAQLERRALNDAEQRRRRFLEDVVAAHDPDPPPTEAEASANRSGERQLAALGRDVRLLEGLVATTAFKLNRHLRTGDAVELDDVLGFVTTGHMSYAEFAADLAAAFAQLGAGIRLDEPAIAFRGASTETLARKHLYQGAVFDDPGYVFATWDEDHARHYAAEQLGRARRGEHRELLLTLELHSALYLPAREQQSKKLLELLYPYSLIRGAIAQFIVPPCAWQIDSVHAVNDAPILVRMTQL